MELAMGETGHCKLNAATVSIRRAGNKYAVTADADATDLDDGRGGAVVVTRLGG